MSETVRIHLLGRDYMLRSQGDAERVQEAAALVDEKLAGMSQTVSVDTRDRLMLALLNLAGEYLQKERSCQLLKIELNLLQTDQLHAAEQRESIEIALIERIEAALDD